MQSIFRYKKITLLRWECRKHLKVRSISFRILWLVVDASIEGVIYSLNILSTRSYFFQNNYNIFIKNTIFLKCIFCCAEENEYAGIKQTINQKHPKKLLLMRTLTQRVEKEPGFQFFSGWKTWLIFCSLYKVVFNLLSLWCVTSIWFRFM